jgi:excinuclease ABC subunit A
LKLAKELSRSSGGRVLYLFDEPTTGLHPHDASRLMRVFDRLVRQGNSVIIIEHNPEVILASDWIIDLGPEGGNRGGEIIFQGTPEEIVQQPGSATGSVLSKRFAGGYGIN